MYVFLFKKSKLFYFHPPACLISQDKTDVNQTINSLRPNAFLLKSAISSHNSCVLTNASGQIFCLAVPLLFCYFVVVGIIIIIYLCWCMCFVSLLFLSYGNPFYSLRHLITSWNYQIYVWDCPVLLFFYPPPFSGKRWGLGFGLEGFWLTDRKLHGIHQIKMAKLNLQNLKSIIYCSSYWSNLWSKYHTFLFPLIISH